MAIDDGAGSDQVEFGTLHFWTDRDWALNGKVMDGPLSQWKVLDRTLILTAANEKKNYVFRCDILTNAAERLNLRRLDTGEELHFFRSSPPPRKPGEMPF